MSETFTEPRCIPCAEDLHDECVRGDCECLCRDGWVKEKFGWRLPVPSERVRKP